MWMDVDGKYHYGGKNEYLEMGFRNNVPLGHGIAPVGFAARLRR
jgi:hypothetical protein